MPYASLEALQLLADVDSPKAEERLSRLRVNAEVDGKFAVDEEVALSGDVERDIPVAVFVGSKCGRVLCTKLVTPCGDE